MDLMANVLIIEDDRVFGKTLTSMFKKAGYFPTVALNGEEGLEVFKTGVFDLVITDIIMPVMEGIETIMNIRRINPDQKIIAMSAGGKIQAQEYLNTARLLRANAMLKKPFTYEELEDALRKLD